jgi:hypothetical protein
VFENRVLRGIFGHKRDEVIRGYERNFVMRTLYSSPRVMRMIKSRKMGWARHIAHMGENRNAYRENQKEINH